MTSSYPSLQTHPSNDASCPALWDALREVMDPEIPISVVDMGLIVELAKQDGIVDLKLTFTAMGCPASEFILEDVRERDLEIRAMEKRIGARDLHCPVCRAEVDEDFLVCPVCTTARQLCIARRSCRAAPSSRSFAATR